MRGDEFFDERELFTYVGRETIHHHERAQTEARHRFEMLREHSRTANRKLVDVASAVVDGHRLLPSQPQAPS